MGGSDEKAFPLRALVFASGSNNYTYKPNKSNKGIQRIGILLEREAFRNDNYGLFGVPVFAPDYVNLNILFFL